MGFLKDKKQYLKKDSGKLLYSYWIFLPIIGWFVLSGYFFKIIGSLMNKEKSLPKMDFTNELKEGFLFFVKSIPAFLAFGIIGTILGIIFKPLSSIYQLALTFFGSLLLIFYYKERNWKNTFQYIRAYRLIKENPKEYGIAFLKLIGVFILTGIPLAILFLITILGFSIGNGFGTIISLLGIISLLLTGPILMFSAYVLGTSLFVNYFQENSSKTGMKKVVKKIKKKLTKTIKKQAKKQTKKK